MRFRQSMLRVWMACPLQAKFKMIDGLPFKQGSKATFGTCAHHALEQYCKSGDVDQAVHAFLEVWDNPELLGVEIEHWNKYTTVGGLRQKGVEIVRAYDAKCKARQRRVVAIEHPFLVPFGKHELTGNVDLVVIEENHHGKEILLVDDWKTNTRKPTRTELALNIQFTTYIYATTQPEFWLGNEAEEGFPPLPNGEWWWSMLQDMPRRGRWIHLWDNCTELDAGARDQQEFERLQRLCDEIEHAIERDVYVPNISGDSCLLCDYANDPCPTRVPTREEWDARFETDENSWL